MQKNIKITILGTGAYGTAMAYLLGQKHQITMYGVVESEVADINNHINSAYFKHIDIPGNVSATTNLELALAGANYIVIAVPSQFILEVIHNATAIIKQPVNWINCAKGVNTDAAELNELFWSQILTKTIPKHLISNIGGMYGPSFAKDIVKDIPFNMVFAANNIDYANEMKALFAHTLIQAEATNNWLSCDFISVYKNVMALASGMVSELYGNASTQSSFIAMAWLEVLTLGKLWKINLGDSPIAAILGDFILTTTSVNSRNYRFGQELASRGPKAIDSSTTTVEGLNTLNVICRLNHCPTTPILGNLKKIIQNECLPRDAFDALWSKKAL